jgi:hypothetical protein
MLSLTADKANNPHKAGCCLVFGAGQKLTYQQFEFSPVEKTCQLEKPNK